ncbi:MAG: hydroxyacylglutathione hydrolase [Candidatus Sericytochromatia bacterium]|nr:MAG: hydroxyacylglutathione hydrolase [Candidatus Sericytochromatia bacterium]
MNDIEVIQFRSLKDNYNWVVYCKETKLCVGIDIYNTEEFFKIIDENKLILKYILNTHHHEDHCGGNKRILEKFSDIEIFASRYDLSFKRIYGQTEGVKENDLIVVGNIRLKVLDVPGHTLGHVVYYNDDVMFVGDTLFASGCGRLFEGSAEQMLKSLKKIIDNAKNETKIYCGHEYTNSNLEFASALNKDYFNNYAKNMKKRKCTIPTNKIMELKYNPFLMVMNETYKNYVLNLNNMSVLEAFTYLRQLKDNYV